MSKTFFVTGTDTDVGKTTSTLALLHAAAAQGLKAVAYKPVAAGCEIMEDGLCNQDVLLLQKNSSLQLSYDQVVGYSFEAFSSPQIASEESVTTIILDIVSEGLSYLQHKTNEVFFFV